MMIHPPSATLPASRRRVAARWLVIVVAVVATGLLFLLRTRQVQLHTIPVHGFEPAILAVINDALREVRAKSNSGEAWGRLGSTLHHYELPSEASAAFTEAERCSPQEARWPYLHGVLLMNRDAAAALRKLRRAVELAPNEPDAVRLRLAGFLAERGYGPEAIVEHRRLLEQNPAHTPAALGLARLYFQRGEPGECHRLLNACGKDIHTRRGALELLAAVRRMEGNSSGARAASETAATFPSDQPWPDPFWEETLRYRVGLKHRRDHANALLDAGQTEMADAALTELARDYPADADVRYLLGWARNQRGQFAGAEPALREHLRLSVGSPKGQAQLAVALLGQRRFEEAIAVLEAGARLKPTWREFHANLGYAKVQLGRLTEAERHYREALSCDPGHAPTASAWSNLHQRLKQPRMR